MRRQEFGDLKSLVYWMYNKIKSGNFGNSGGGSGGITQTQLDNALDNKVDKVSGKGLSTNDYTTEDKNKINLVGSKLDKGTYTGTAKDLKDAIDAVNSKTIHWNDIQNKPSLNYLPTTGGTVTGEIKLNNTLLINDIVRVVARNNSGTTIAFGNKLFNDLIYGEFKGIRIWGNDSDDKVVLAGGGVKNINEIAPSYKTITDAHKFLDKDGTIHFGSGSGIANAPSSSFYEMIGFTHSSKNWGFIIAKNLDEDDKSLFVKQVIGGSYKEWFKIKENDPVGNIINGTRQILPNEADKVIFITNSIDNCALNVLSNKCSVSFRKVFDGGYVNFTCLGKNIIYTGDNQFNGKKGSTAVVSIYENDCYIDIRNI